MIQIDVFGDSDRTRSFFEPVAGKKEVALLYHPPATLRKRVKGLRRDSIVYVDVSAFGEEESERIVKYLARQQDLHYGILDPDGRIMDVALLFLQGAGDYIGRELVRKGLKLTRLKKIMRNGVLRAGISRYPSISPAVQESPSPERPDLNGLKPSGANWSSIRSGQEYTFSLMFIEIDHQGELGKSIGEDMMSDVTVRFKNLIHKWVARDNGRVWIWDDFGGLVLFPFDGADCTAAISCFRLMLNRKLIGMEELGTRLPLSFRIVLHIGNTVYRQKGKTGTLISDSINTIFHLGKKFAKPDNLYTTRSMLGYVPLKLRNYFIPAGDYEGIPVMRMLQPV